MSESEEKLAKWRKRLNEVADEMLELTIAHKAVPPELEVLHLRLLERVAEEKDRPRIALQRAKLMDVKTHRAGLSMETLPREVLAAIAGFEGRGITPYHPNME